MDKGKKFRVHSTVDRIPRELRRALVSMIVDDVWPDDCPRTRRGKLRYEDMAKYLKEQGHPIHKASIGRLARRIQTQARMKDAGRTVRDVMNNLDKENASETQKATAEMITAVIIENLVSGEEPTIEDIKSLSKAVKDCAWVSMKADEYIRQRIADRVREADKNIGVIAKKKCMDPETLRIIREQVYGIVGDRLDYEPGGQDKDSSNAV